MSSDERAELLEERNLHIEACRHLKTQIQNREGSQGDLGDALQFEEFQAQLAEHEARILEIDALLDL